MLKFCLLIFLLFRYSAAVDSIPELKENGEKSTYTQFDSQTKLEVNKEHKRVIKIGHIGAVGVMPNDARILNISKESLIEEGLVGEDIEFEAGSCYEDGHVLEHSDHLVFKCPQCHLRYSFSFLLMIVKNIKLSHE
uniref:Uncharacterized protein n=1 Tax=Caenorhabditis japonica TaxID=281687 RepID=A0A8R1EJW2_CAEJA